jgi:glutamate decarboxylase
MHPKKNIKAMRERDTFLTPVYAARELNTQVPKYEIPESEMAPRNAYDLVHDELMLDGNSRLNLATFVTTWMEPEARQLMTDTFDKNMIDKDEYPQTAELEMRCVNILSRLWNSPDHEEATGTSTTGSSEAAMLGGMALKWKWREKRKAQGKPTDKPNLVMGINVQVCWEKFCRYWDVEPRLVPMEGDRYHLSAEEAVKLCDENTIGVVGIMGSTFDGSYEPIKEISDALDKLQQETGLDIPIHVDGASGGFVAPFIQPDLEWDFRLPRVKSINASGHKYGLVYPGVGWVVWRDKKELPEDLIFYVNYLGGEMPTFAINFSRPGNQIVAQYYNFLRLGREGYTRIQQACQDVALYLSGEIAKLGPFELITDGSDIPVFAFKLKDDVTNFSVFDMSERLRDRGWLLPAYTFPANREDLAALRVVVKEGFSHDMADLLLADMRRHIAHFASQPNRIPKTSGSCFSHTSQPQKAGKTS